MPFEKVETQVDFPAQERAILEFWDEIGAFEKLRAKNRGKPKWSFLDGPITANNPMGVHHAWGRTYKDAYQRYFAMTGHELRYQNGFDCQGLWVEVEVEKELEARSPSATSRTSSPATAFASIDQFVQLCKDRVDKFARVQTEQSIRLGYWMDWDRTDADWAKPPDERKSYFTMSEENNYTIWAFLKKCHDAGLVYRGYDAMPWCPRCGVGISQMEMKEGYQLVAHRAVFVQASRCADRPGENLLVWTTTPWTLTSNVGAAVNPELTYLKVKHKDEIYYVAKGAFTAQRLEERVQATRQWVEGVPKLKTLEQIFKEKRAATRSSARSKARTWSAGRTTARSTSCRPSSTRPAIPTRSPTSSSKQKWAPAQVGPRRRTASSPGTTSARPRAPASSTSPRAAARTTSSSARSRACRRSPRSTRTASSSPGFGALTGKSAVDPATTDWILDNLQEKGLLFAVEKYPHSYPHCWRCKTELLFRLVDEWFIDMKWRDEIMEVVEQVTFLPESINGKARELDWLENMGDWMISKKRFWGLALPIWVDEETGDFEVIGSPRGTEGARRRGLGRVRGPHAAPAVDRPGQDPQSEDRQPDVAASPTSATPGSTPASCRTRRWSYNTRPRLLGEVVPGRLHHRELPRPVPQLVLRHAGDEHDDGADGRRSRCCSATAWCATSTARRCTSRRATPSSSRAADRTTATTLNDTHKDRQERHEHIRRWAPT